MIVLLVSHISPFIVGEKIDIDGIGGLGENATHATLAFIVFKLLCLLESMNSDDRW